MNAQRLILVVEDDNIFRMLLEEALSMWGFRVVACENGEEGVDAFSHYEDEIEVVLLDMIMPKKGGRQTFYEIRAIDPNAQVILLSGYSTQGHVEELLKDGARGFLAKPFEISELKNMIQTVMQSHQGKA